MNRIRKLTHQVLVRRNEQNDPVNTNDNEVVIENVENSDNISSNTTAFIPNLGYINIHIGIL